jgi:plasmid stabilization system protein ParE
VATSEASKKLKFMCDEIEGYLFDMRRVMDIYEGLVRRESPESAVEVRQQFDAVIQRINELRDAGRSMELPQGLEPLKQAVALCKDALKRVEVGVNQFSQTEIRVEPH